MLRGACVEQMVLFGLLLSGCLACLGLVLLVAGSGSLAAGEYGQGCGWLLTGGLLLPLALLAGGLLLLMLNGG